MDQGSSEADALSGFVSGLRYQQLPRRVVEHAKMIVLDTLGAMLRSTSLRKSPAKILKEYASKWAAKQGEASLVGLGLKTDLMNALLINGTLAYYCDVESHHPSSITHVAAVVVPSALTLAEKLNSPGQALITSIVAGYEADTRVSLAADPNELYRRGFHPSAVAGCFGAAAAAGSLLGLDPQTQLASFGLAGLQASGLLAWVSDHTENSRPLQIGFAARNGVLAAILASMGYGAPKNIFTGKNGFLYAFSDRPNPKKLSEGLGEKYTIEETAFKNYSCCAFLHPAVDALLAIMENNKVNHTQIKSITLRFPSQGAPVIDNNELKSHNAQYVLSVAAVKGRVDIDDILDNRLEDPEISRLSKATRVLHDQSLSTFFPASYPSIVTVETVEGKTYSARVDHARGTPQNPVGMEEIVAKFRRLAGGAIEPSRVEACIDLVRHLEEHEASELVEIIGG